MVSDGDSHPFPTIVSTFCRLSLAPMICEFWAPFVMLLGPFSGLLTVSPCLSPSCDRSQVNLTTVECRGDRSSAMVSHQKNRETMEKSKVLEFIRKIMEDMTDMKI